MDNIPEKLVNSDMDVEMKELKHVFCFQVEETLKRSIVK